ncbi:unnamed protein product [marine sediment metagenome]|uniref:Uncharacterized protein n=1 Tax=marine sediment metagenome TaxID=412755 RepID=X1FT78_9ZZZZ
MGHEGLKRKLLLLFDEIQADLEAGEVDEARDKVRTALDLLDEELLKE